MPGQAAAAEKLADIEPGHHSRLRRLLPGLERLYRRYNRRRFVSPDPLQVLYDYPDARDREIAGIIASGLAFGRVEQTLAAIHRVLEPMGASPRQFLLAASSRDLSDIFSSFQYRFVKGGQLSAFLGGLKAALLHYGSLESLFSSFLPPEAAERGRAERPEELIAALSGGVERLLELSGLASSYLLASPAKKSACKRLFLYLRWMVRKDRVDPGGWQFAAPSCLVVPLDTHMFHIACDLSLTSRRQANLAAALEITRGFSRICPEDPVKYDFVLTRFGIRQELERSQVPDLVLTPEDKK